MGNALLGAGKQTEAEEKWSKAIELKPELKAQIEGMRKQLVGED